MECPNCKKNLADNAKSCPECGYDFTEQIAQKALADFSKGGCGCLIIIVIILACFLNSYISEVTDENTYTKCSQERLKQYASNEEDLLITHEATEVITGYAEYDNKYVVKVNRNLWDKLNYEQRILIRCSTETIGHKKGLKGVVLDPKTNEQLN